MHNTGEISMRYPLKAKTMQQSHLAQLSPNTQLMRFPHNFARAVSLFCQEFFDMCVYVCVCVHACVHACMCVCVCVCVCMHACVCCVMLCVHECINACKFSNMHCTDGTYRYAADGNKKQQQPNPRKLFFTTTPPLPLRRKRPYLCE